MGEGGGDKASVEWSLRDIQVGCSVGSLELRRKAWWSLGPLVYRCWLTAWGWTSHEGPLEGWEEKRQHLSGKGKGEMRKGELQRPAFPSKLAGKKVCNSYSSPSVSQRPSCDHKRPLPFCALGLLYKGPGGVNAVKTQETWSQVVLQNWLSSGLLRLPLERGDLLGPKHRN